jgi:hypothetical protein
MLSAVAEFICRFDTLASHCGEDGEIRTSCLGVTFNKWKERINRRSAVSCSRQSNSRLLKAAYRCLYVFVFSVLIEPNVTCTYLFYRYQDIRLTYLLTYSLTHLLLNATIS